MTREFENIEFELRIEIIINDKLQNIDTKTRKYGCSQCKGFLVVLRVNKQGTFYTYKVLVCNA